MGGEGELVVVVVVELHDHHQGHDVLHNVSIQDMAFQAAAPFLYLVLEDPITPPSLGQEFENVPLVKTKPIPHNPTHLCKI